MGSRVLMGSWGLVGRRDSTGRRTPTGRTVAGVAWALGAIVTMAVAVAGCDPETAGVRRREDVKSTPEQHDLVPVGGYQTLAGEWGTVRTDEVQGRHPVLLQIEVDKDVLAATAQDSSVRFQCQASHRTCLGTWADNRGHGRVVLTLGLDMKSFTGSYDGTILGRDVGRTTWTGTKH